MLRSGGQYLLAICDEIGRNALSAATQGLLIELFSENPPLFLCEGPFEEVERLLLAFEGLSGIDAPMSAHIVTATK